MLRIIAIVLVVATACIARAGAVEGVAATQPARKVSLRMYQPAQASASEWGRLYPVVVEVTSADQRRITVVGPRSGVAKSDFDPKRYPRGWSLHLVVEQRGATGSSTGSILLPAEQEYVIAPGQSGLVKGYAASFLFGDGENLLTAVLVLDGEPVAASEPLVVRQWGAGR